MLEGYAFAHGLPPMTQWPLGVAARFVWWWLTAPEVIGHAVDQAAVDKLWADVWVPPPGEDPDPRGPWSDEAVSTQFSAAKKGLGL